MPSQGPKREPIYSAADQCWLMPTTKGHFAKIDEEDKDWAAQFNWYAKDGYAARRLPGSKYVHRHQRMHREIMERTGIELTDQDEVDHVNGTRNDNRRRNLRKCVRQQNRLNLGMYRNNTSGIKGVRYVECLQKYRAVIYRHNVRYDLGVHETAEQARVAYEEAARRLHGEFVRKS